jgi:uncharacterized protein YaiI (UPF0178 family)
MAEIYVDADGCPVKDEVCRVALRHHLAVTFVANSRTRIPDREGTRLVVVGGGFDAADDWIVEHAGPGDVVVTADIPLADRCLKKGARALSPKGKPYTPDSIGEAMAARELSAYLREMGAVTGGPAPFAPKDRSRFLHALDECVRAALGSPQPPPPGP